MLAPQHHTNVRKAEAYFDEHLAVGDYYSEHQVLRGEWLGAGARMLGLSAVVQKQEFLALCENRDPHTGETLTVRTRTRRRDGDKEVADRRLFYDFTISPPKSVSIAALVAGDERLMASHDRAVRVAMSELERFAATRVRRGNRNADRPTGNLVTAVFRHDTSRALDPHLHSHCLVFNATFDLEEGRWKALQNYEMYQARKYVENVYYHELARDLRRFGYPIRNQARGDFELEGMPPALLRQFSKRHDQINAQMRELLAKAPELARRNRGAIREHIAHTLRPSKAPTVTLETLREVWQGQLKETHKETLAQLCQREETGTPPFPANPVPEVERALRWAEEHLFDRKSLVREHELWRFALERLRGGSFSLEDLQAATRRAPYLRDRHNPLRLTTHTAAKREWDLICLAREGCNACAPLIEHWQGHPALEEDQQAAARQLLQSLDRIILFRGGAGTGKSFTLKTVHDALRAEGRAVQVLAPQRQQVEGLAMDGMTGAQTVSEFLTRRRMGKGAVVIVDEAGQIGAKDMLTLLTFIQRHRGRVILSGDTRQHGPVQASDAMVAIEQYGHLHVAELHEIRRQDPARGRDEQERLGIAAYRQAVQEASAGDIHGSFDRLDHTEAIVEYAAGEQQTQLAQHYLELVQQGCSALVVSPTWGEIHRVNEAVRQELRAAGLVGAQQWQVTVFQADDLTDAQKCDARYYNEDRMIVFHQTSRGIPKGAVGSLVAVTDESIIVEAAGRIRSIPVAHASRLTVGKSQSLTLSQGDRLQLKANAKTVAGERLMNGELVTVRQVDQQGRIHLEDGRVLPPQYRQFVRGYAVTSYASQGKTVDHVLYSDSGIRAATNDQQWYVTISRGRLGVKIFTTDKQTLRENVVRSGKRALAMDIVAEDGRRARIGNRTVSMNAPEYAGWCVAQHQRARQIAATPTTQTETPSIILP